MKYILLTFIIISTSVFTACSSGGSGASSQSPFEGIWFSDEILAYKESKNPKFICSNIENNKWTNYQNELLIDAFKIDAVGNVSDFNINSVDNVVMFKVRDDGSTFDNIFLKKDDGNCTNCEDLIGFTLEMEGEDKLINIVELKSEDNEVIKSRVEFVKMNEDEVAEINNVFNNCKLFSQEIYDKCIAAGVDHDKCNEISYN